MARTSFARTVLPACALILLVTASGCGSASDLVGASHQASHAARSGRHTVTPTLTPGTGSTPPTTTPTTPPTTPTKPRSKGAPGRRTLPAVVTHVAWFESPSRNIGCLIGSRAVRCDIGKHHYRPGRRPASCHGSWGSSVHVNAGRAAGLGCVTDTVLGGRTVLRYGTSTVHGRFGCTSRFTGMYCYDLHTSHWFFIARQGYRLR
ncbi:MAG: DUF6636 domain-containing protein [Nocardioidaceae bacterium]